MYGGKGKKKSVASKRVAKADKAVAKATAKPTAKNKMKAAKAIKKKRGYAKPQKPTYRNTL